MRAAILCLRLVLDRSSPCGTYRAAARRRRRHPRAMTPRSRRDDGASRRHRRGHARRAPPLGATPHPGGVSFRVWAPHAAHVFVVGDFNAWNATANELAAESSGGRRPASSPATSPAPPSGQQYAYALTLADGTTRHARRSARAPAATAPPGPVVLVDPTAYAVEDDRLLSRRRSTTRSSTSCTSAASCARRRRPSAPGPTPPASSTTSPRLGVNAVEMMPPVDVRQRHHLGLQPVVAVRHAQRRTARPTTPRRSSTPRTPAASPSTSTSSTTTTRRRPALWCWDGDCPANASLLHGQRAQIDAVGPAPRLLAPTRCARSSATTRSSGSTSIAPTGCAGTRPSASAPRLGPTGVAIPDGASLLARGQRRGARAVAAQARDRRGSADRTTPSRSRPARAASASTRSGTPPSSTPSTTTSSPPTTATARWRAIAGAIAHAYNGAATCSASSTPRTTTRWPTASRASPR